MLRLAPADPPGNLRGPAVRVCPVKGGAVAGGSGFITLEEYLKARSVRLLRVAYLLTGDVHAAEDLVQTALLRVWPHWSRVVGAGDPDAYTRTCLVNAFLSQRRRRMAPEVLVATHDGTERGVQDHHGLEVETRLVVLSALARLPRRQRLTIVLRYFEDLSERQVADVMGCGIGTLKGR
jgi:RNA polymerase sigma-70 factor (sigma-E family)